MGSEHMWASECPAHCRHNEKRRRVDDGTRHGKWVFESSCGQPTTHLVFIKVAGQGIYSVTLCRQHAHVHDNDWGFRELREYDRSGPKTCECHNPDEFARGRY